MSIDARVKAIMAAHDTFWPTPSDGADPADWWVGETWAARSAFEGEVRAALAAEADQGTGDGAEPQTEAGRALSVWLDVVGGDRRPQVALIAFIEREAVAAWLASPDTVDLMARALHTLTVEQPGLLSDADMLNDPQENDSRPVAAALIEAMKREME